MSPSTLSLLSEVRTAYAKLQAKRAAEAVPSADDILAEALDEYGMREAWENGSLSGRDRLDVLHEIRLIARAWFRDRAEAVVAKFGPKDDTEAKALLGRAKDAVKGFFGKASKYIRNMFAAGLLAINGPGPLTADEIRGIDENHVVQLEFLNEFERQVLAEDKPLGGRFVAQAELYGGAAYTVPQNIALQVTRRGTVFDQERRVHYGPRSENDPCTVCAAQEQLGWSPIGTLLPLGASPCKTACHCGFLFRKGDDGPVHIISGRHPWKRED